MSAETPTRIVTTVEALYEMLSPWLGERRKARYGELLAERRASEASTASRAHHFPRGAFTQATLP